MMTESYKITKISIGKFKAMDKLLEMLKKDKLDKRYEKEIEAILIQDIITKFLRYPILFKYSYIGFDCIARRLC